MLLAEPRHTESHSRLLKSCAFLPSYQQQSITIQGLKITKLRRSGEHRSTGGGGGRPLPLQMPLVATGLAPKLHSSPLVWSQGCVRLQSSLSCLAQTLQQPQPSGTSPTPGAHCGTAAGHWQAAGQGEPRACGAETAAAGQRRGCRAASGQPRAEPSLPPRTYQAGQAQEGGRQSGAGTRGAHVERRRRRALRGGCRRREAASAERGRRGLRRRRGAGRLI